MILFVPAISIPVMPWLRCSTLFQKTARGLCVCLYPPSYAGEAAAVVDTAKPERASETYEKCSDMRDGT